MSDKRPFDAADLIARAQAGEREALNALLEAVRPLLHGERRCFMSEALRAKFDLSDLIQETLMDAARSFEQFHGETLAELMAWMRAILRNNARDAGRRIPREEPLGDRPVVQPGETPSDAAAITETDLAIRVAFERLSADDRQVIELRQSQGLEFAEVARQMGREEGAVRRLFARALIRWHKEAFPGEEEPAARE